MILTFSMRSCDATTSSTGSGPGSTSGQETGAQSARKIPAARRPAGPLCHARGAGRTLIPPDGIYVRSRAVQPAFPDAIQMTGELFADLEQRPG
jgi:hypothetical protein